jgi:hypothetical protein
MKMTCSIPGSRHGICGGTSLKSRARSGVPLGEDAQICVAAYLISILLPIRRPPLGLLIPRVSVRIPCLVPDSKVRYRPRVQYATSFVICSA